MLTVQIRNRCDRPQLKESRGNVPPDLYPHASGSFAFKFVTDGTVRSSVSLITMVMLKYMASISDVTRTAVA